MTRLKALSPVEATGNTREMFTAINNKFGVVSFLFVWGNNKPRNRNWSLQQPFRKKSSSRIELKIPILSSVPAVRGCRVHYRSGRLYTQWSPCDCPMISVRFWTKLLVVLQSQFSRCGRSLVS